MPYLATLTPGSKTQIAVKSLTTYVAVYLISELARKDGKFTERCEVGGFLCSYLAGILEWTRREFLLESASFFLGGHGG